MLVKARAKAEAIQLLAAALAQQVRDGSWGQPQLWCWHWGRQNQGQDGTRLSCGYSLASSAAASEEFCCFGGLYQPGRAGDRGTDEALGGTLSIVCLFPSTAAPLPLSLWQSST